MLPEDPSQFLQKDIVVKFIVEVKTKESVVNLDCDKLYASWH